MGMDCAHFFYYEKRQIHDRKIYKLAKTFSNTFRYINDLLTINNPNFESKICNIYPPQLELK